MKSLLPKYCEDWEIEKGEVGGKRGGHDVCVLIDRKQPARREAECEDTDLSDWLRTESVGAGFCNTLMNLQVP